MTNHEKEAYLEHSISISEDAVKEQIECAKEHAKAFLANIAERPGNLRLALGELDTLVQELQNTLHQAEAANCRMQAQQEALKLLKA